MPAVPDAESMTGIPLSFKKRKAHAETARNKGRRFLLRLILHEKVCP